VSCASKAPATDGSNFGAPFRVGFDRAGLRGVHHVARDACELVLDDGTVHRLTAGDL
jgi:hypothetical protein